MGRVFKCVRVYAVCVCIPCSRWSSTGARAKRLCRVCVQVFQVTSVCVRLVPGLCDVCDVSCVWTRCVDRDCVCDRMCM